MWVFVFFFSPKTLWPAINLTHNHNRWWREMVVKNAKNLFTLCPIYLKTFTKPQRLKECERHTNCEHKPLMKYFNYRWQKLLFITIVKYNATGKLLNKKTGLHIDCIAETIFVDIFVKIATFFRFKCCNQKYFSLEICSNLNSFLKHYILLLNTINLFIFPHSYPFQV